MFATVISFKISMHAQRTTIENFMNARTFQPQNSSNDVLGSCRILHFTDKFIAIKFREQSGQVLSKVFIECVFVFLEFRTTEVVRFVYCQFVQLLKKFGEFIVFYKIIHYYMLKWIGHESEIRFTFVDKPHV